MEAEKRGYMGKRGRDRAVIFLHPLTLQFWHHTLTVSTPRPNSAQIWEILHKI